MLKADQIFDNAEVYHASALLLAQQLPQGRPQFAPASIALAAFALELYFKSLVLIDTGKEVWGHDLHELFLALSPATQSKVRDQFDHRTCQMQAAILKGSGVNFDLDYVLKQAKDAFQQMRYFYDTRKRADNSGWNANSVIDAVRAVILEMRPEWPVQQKNALPTFPTR